jgi:hypothetical protein
VTKSVRDKWIRRLKNEDKAHSEWRKQADTANAAYFSDLIGQRERAEGRTNPNSSYPLFWSTVKVAHGRIYSQPPKPDVRKRYQDDPGAKPVVADTGDNESAEIGAAAPAGAAPAQGAVGPQGGAPQPVVDDNKLAQCIERAILYTIDTTDFDINGHAAVNDFLVTALGVAKVEMDIQTADVPVLNPVTREPIFDPESGEPVMQSVVVDRTLDLRHYAWSQFRWEPQQHWSQVSWVGFDHWMTKQEIEDQFKVDLSASGTSTNDNDGGRYAEGKPQANKYREQFKVTEVWDKATRKRIFVTQAHDDTLEETDDPLGLKDFFPCPKPMMLNLKPDDLVPKPDYSYCESMFVSCNRIANRITALMEQIKDIGFYDASFTELANLPNLTDGQLAPIPKLLARIDALTPGGSRAGYDAIVCKQDNAGKVQVVQELLMLLDQYKQRIWEIYGISDIQRGSTNPNETATAQSIKAEWANVRVGERIRLVALFFRDIFRIMAEIIAEKYEPDVLSKMTGIELNEEEMEILRSDYSRCYAIDVESDSTVVQDETAEKQQRMEFMQTLSSYAKELVPAVQSGALPAEFVKEALLFVTNSFKSGRQLEQAINALPGTMEQLSGLNQQIQQLQQQLQQAQQQLQEQGKQLQQVNMGKEQRENVKTASDAQQKAALTEKTQIESAAIAQDIHKGAVEPIRMVG